MVSLSAILLMGTETSKGVGVLPACLKKLTRFMSHDTSFCESTSTLMIIIVKQLVVS